MLITCPNCNEEIDIRHGMCPLCFEEIKFDEKHVEYDTFEKEDEWTESDWGQDID